MSHWIMNAIISGVFPVLAARSKVAPFVLFSGAMALQFLIVLVVYPETKGVSLEAMEERVESIAPWPSGIAASDDYKEV